MSEPLDTIQREWAVARTAPWSFLTIAITVGSAVWYLTGQINNATVSAKDATIETLKTENLAYKDKLKGATPEEASARMKALEERLSSLEGRHIDKQKLAKASAIIKRLPGEKYHLSIVSDIACSDCPGYAGQLLSIFPQPPWEIAMPMVGGPARRSPKGNCSGREGQRDIGES